MSYILVVYTLYLITLDLRRHITWLGTLLRDFAKIRVNIPKIFQDIRRVFRKSDMIFVGVKIRVQQSCGLVVGLICKEMSQKIDICKFAANFMCKLGGSWDRCKFALQIRTWSYFPQH